MPGEDTIDLPKGDFDQDIFTQILEMDDDEEDREFSRSIVFGFFDQAEQTFSQMDKGIKEKDLDELSSLGHFLKGSSATLGLKKVMKSCEKIQHLGHKKDETGQHEKPADFCLDAIKTELPKLRKDYDDAEKALRKFYGEES